MADMDDWEPTSSEARLAQALFRRVDEVAAEAAQRQAELSQTVHVMEGDLRLLGRRVGSLAVKTSLVDAWRHEVDVWRDDMDHWRGEVDIWRGDVDKRFDRIDAWRRDVDVWRVSVDTKLDKILVAVGAETRG